MKHPKLAVTKREVFGKQVKKLRREGLLPANVYGKDIASTAVQVPLHEFQDLYKEVHETGLVDIQLDGKSRPVLIKNVQMNYQTHTPLHADFYQVNLKEKIRTMVPVTIIGEAAAVTEKLGVLLTQLSEVEVEALPEELPEAIEVEVTSLAAVDEQITAGDLKAPAGVTILTEAAQTVVRIGELVQEEPEEAAPVAEEGIATAEAAEGAASESSDEEKEAA